MRALALIVALLWLGPVARAQPRVELYTMGPGRELFSAFGHAAICVLDEQSPQGRCYNYGTADFSTPLPLTWSFVRGRALFWVGVGGLPSMLASYVAADRTVFRQRLTLDDHDARAVADALQASTDEHVRYYRYHHFNDNCTTRIRDVLDHATGGRLRRDTRARDLTFREYAREGFRGSWPLLAVTELILGRSADQRTDSWTAMFLPAELRAEVAARWSAPPETVYMRRGPPPSGNTYGGTLAFVVAGAVLALLVLVGAFASSPGRALAFRLACVPTGLVLGLTAMLIDGMALLSVFPELTRNEAVLAFWPTDLALCAMPLRWLRPYAVARVVAILLVAIGHLAGLTQPMAPLALCLFPLAALAWAARHVGRDHR